MGSPLTSTSVRSAWLFLGLMLLVVLTVIYLYFFRSPSIEENFKQQARYANYEALKNSIRFANYRFIVSDTSLTTLDIWRDGDQALDYNRAGFPIGTALDENDVLAITNKSQCVQVWRFLLGPLRPSISENRLRGKAGESEYWVKLSTPNKNNQTDCLFISLDVSNFTVRYRPENGTVEIVTTMSNLL